MKVCLFNYRKFQLDLQLDWPANFRLIRPRRRHFLWGVEAAVESDVRSSWRAG